MHEAISRNVYEGFWKLGQFPRTSTIRLDKTHPGSELYDFRAECYEIPDDFIKDPGDLEQWQSALDRMPQHGMVMNFEAEPIG